MTKVLRQTPNRGGSPAAMPGTSTDPTVSSSWLDRRKATGIGPGRLLLLSFWGPGRAALHEMKRQPVEAASQKGGHVGRD